MALLNYLNKYRFFIYLIFLFCSLIFISIFYPLLPLTGDEAWNYLGFARYGPIFTLTHYELPNNHIFFTFIQSFFAHKKILIYFPLELRVFNCLVGALFLYLSGLIICRILKKEKSIKLLFSISMLIFFASPLLTPYFISGRGYLLGSLLLFLGINFFLKKKFYYSSIFFILSIWTIPTFILTLPLIYLASMIVDKKYRASIFISGAIIPLSSIILYSPVIKDLIHASKFGWGYNSLSLFIDLTFNSLSNLFLVPLGSLIFVVTYFFSLIIIVNKGNKKLKKFTLYLFLANSSYLLLVVFQFILGLSTLPFVRNGIFIPIFVSITISCAFLISSHKKKIFIGLILVLNLFVGFYLFTKLLPFNKNFYPFFEGEQVYTSKPLIKFLDNGGDFIYHDSKDTILIMYYSFINSVPIKD